MTQLMQARILAASDALKSDDRAHLSAATQGGKTSWGPNNKR
ncbi:hypothetical protein [Erythrobacter sp. KY5]|nr:hypothetical protein [Erythrobacter sp. KY5]